MKFKVRKASDSTFEALDKWDCETSSIWDCETLEDLIKKIKECGNEIILDEDGNIIIYDDRVE